MWIAGAHAGSAQAPNVDAVLFDCDGVLVDSEPITNGVLAEMLRDLGWPISDEACVDIFVGHALKNMWAVILEHTGFRIDEAWIALFRARRDERLREQLRAIPGALDAVADISTRMEGRIACASGADLGKVSMQLQLTGFAEFFAGRVFSGMELPHSKPAPDVYLAAAAALGVDPRRSLVIEDTVSGVTAGVAAGATVLGFAPGGPTHTSAETLLAAGAARVFTQMSELPSLIVQFVGDSS